MLRNVLQVRIQFSTALFTYLNTHDHDRVKELPPLQVGDEISPVINQGSGETQEGFEEKKFWPVQGDCEVETSRLLARNMSFREVSPITGDSIDKLQSILLKQNGKELSDNDTNALIQNDMVKHKLDDIDEHENDNTNHIGIVEGWHEGGGDPGHMPGPSWSSWWCQGWLNRMGFYPYHSCPAVLETDNNSGSIRNVTNWVKELLLEDPERRVKQKQDTSEGGVSLNSYN